jgi:hypothetical protein
LRTRVEVAVGAEVRVIVIVVLAAGAEDWHRVERFSIVPAAHSSEL